MSAQTANYPPVYKTGQFAFLAKPPPPPQKRRPSPNQPLPALPGTPPPPPQQLQRRPSNTFSSIVNWAAHVQPGSPAPRSPQRRPSITSTTSSRRPSLSRLNRRPSISHGRAPSGSFVHIIDTPTRTQSTPSVANFDLTALGYTSIFVHFPKTPTTPSPLLRQHQTNRTGAPDHSKPASPAPVPLSASFAFAHIPIPPVPQENVRPTKRTGMKRFRSLSILRPRGSKAKGTQPPASPTKTTVSTKSAKPMNAANSKSLARASPTTTHTSKESKAEICAATIAKRKRAKYAYVRPPPPLANELAMMQFADGGSLESHAKRVMDAQAKAAAGSGASIGVADVYRDGKGGMWWDADEEMEYAHLLGGTGAVADADMMAVDADGDVEMGWEEFDAEPLAPFFSETHASQHDKENHPEAGSRRSSLSSVDSDLDPKYLVPLPENEDPRLAPVDDRVLASRKVGSPGMSVLSLPARPRRRAMHLCKPAFLVDVKAFQAPRSPVRSSSGASGSTISGQHGAGKPRGKARRRPAPLKLANSSSTSIVVVVRRPSVSAVVPGPVAPAVASPGGVARLRREFIEDSFAPRVPTPIEAAPPVATGVDDTIANLNTTKQSKSKLATGVRGFFTIRRGD
ncbi:hypothetical protein GALMADRAFT_241242 [Galerina marginata CBS 339.88]|uniref:Uncharacterized protein n=1 Tax=Galerina marginata (strain CBS 339.88) TaxID=685588 RepID=A0A067TC45_GALM3|nr:hypothetical protein GALMADRAFT_241242 [Galerina marginata CBS 339.88]